MKVAPIASAGQSFFPETEVIGAGVVKLFLASIQVCRQADQYSRASADH